MELKILCHKCQHEWTFQPPLERRAECPACRYDARTCLNCRHFDAGSYHECREEQAEWVKDKERANFCSYFAPRGERMALSEAERAKARLAGLFGAPKDGQEGAAPRQSADLGSELAAFLAKKR